MRDITRSAPAPHLMRGCARLWPDIALFSCVFYSPTQASLVATSREHISLFMCQTTASPVRLDSLAVVMMTFFSCPEIVSADAVT